MAVLYNLARMTVTAASTGTITLSSAATVSGVTYLTFAAAGVSGGNTVSYAIADSSQSETGTATYNSSNTTLTSRTPTRSTNSNNAINMSSAAQVFITARAEDIPNLDAWSTWTPTFSMTTTSTTPITASVSGTGAQYKTVGKTVLFTLDATITNVGSGNNGAFQATLPVPLANASGIVVGSGREVITLGVLLSLANGSSNQVNIVQYNNTSLISGGNGTRVNCGGFYQSS
jgi:hypothetical protein